MHNLNFCCEKFETYYTSNNQSAPNIRIVKYCSDFLLNSAKEMGKYKYPYRYYITFGYKEFQIDMLAIFMEYCPFCGTDLFEFYQSDEYANEIEGQTFTIKA